MALIQAVFMSKCLKRLVPINVVLPIGPRYGDDVGTPPYKTLYLLHGVTGNFTDWIADSHIREIAEHKGFAVVTVSGDNSFYIDGPRADEKYGQFVGQEILDVTRKMFPLSAKREDTFIAGQSMGGYGSLVTALRYHENYSALGAFGPAIHYFETQLGGSFYSYMGEEAVFGDLNKNYYTEINPRVLIEKLLEKKSENDSIHIPRIYIACGTEDSLLPYSQSFTRFLNEKGIEYTYDEGPGIHYWTFWEPEIEKYVEWLGL